MSTKRKVISSLIILAGAVLLGLFVWRVIAINLKYPAPTLKSYEIGETANYADTFELTVIDAEFLSDEAKKSLDVESTFGDYERECLVATLKIKNISHEPQMPLPEGLTFQAGAFFNGPMLQFMEQLNGWSEMPELQANEELVFKVLTLVPKSRFRDSQWETVTQREFEMVIALYPEKQVLKLQ